MSLQVKMSAVNENPFYGKTAIKNLLNTGKSVNSKSQMDSLLDNAWKECINKKDRELFFIVCFSIGDITNRQHNIFEKQDVDNGGEACRPQMMWILSWIRKNHSVQYYKFMFNRIITEFISWFAILAGQVRTIKGKKNIDIQATETYSALKEHDLNKVAEFIADRFEDVLAQSVDEIHEDPNMNIFVTLTQANYPEMKIYKADLGVEGMFRCVGFSEQ